MRELSGGDRRSIGNADRVAAHVVKHLEEFDELFDLMLHSDPVVASRAADAAEKVTRERPELVEPHASELIERVADVHSPQVRWHVALMLPRLTPSDATRERIADLLSGWLEDPSRLVRVNSMQGLAELAEQNRALEPRVLDTLEQLAGADSPAVRARARKLLERLSR